MIDGTPTKRNSGFEMNPRTLNWVLAAVLAISLGSQLFGRIVTAERKYPLLSKRLFVQNQNDLIINFTPLRAELNTYIAKQPERIGVYFEYLPTGTSININGNAEFYRASLVKLPGIMRAYKLIEDGKLSKFDVLEVKDYHVNQFFTSPTVLKVGDGKTVDELIGLVLRESHNTAYEMLYERVNGDILKKSKDDEQSIDDVYDFLDINRSATDQTLFISPKSYTSILKSLYFSAYLSYDSSSEILTRLTESVHTDWLPKPIPTDRIKVAHKFGVFDLPDPANYKVNADCGIVYVPKRPYALCVMVQHSNVEGIGKHIAEISRLVYAYVTPK